MKYVDADGNIKDKNTTIKTTGIAGYAYAMTENSFSAYFGSTAANGVLIRYEDSSVYYEIDYDIDTYYIKNGYYHNVLQKEERQYAIGPPLIYACVPGVFGVDNSKWNISIDESGFFFNISTIDGGIKKYLGSMVENYYVYGMEGPGEPYLELSDEPEPWFVTAVSGGGYTFRHQTGGYLYQNGGEFDMQSTLPDASSADYEKFLWEVANSSTYERLRSNLAFIQNIL